MAGRKKDARAARRRVTPARPKRAPARKRAPETATDDRLRRGGPIVAIGASAGGLEALEKFFERMPPDSGMAFIVVTHLDAHHKSAMVELIQRRTAMRVAEIADGMRIEANRVHVISPNAILTIVRGALRISSPRDHTMVIDTFLRTLAEDQEENAIGIILSGSGSDGAQGIRAIKEHGGLTLAQTGQSAGYDSMPVSAAATGQVDFVLPIEEMPARLVQYALYLRALGAGKRGDAFREEARQYMVRICTLLRTRIGHDFSRYKESTFMRRLQRRMQVVQLDTVASYVELLRKDGREIELLFRDLLIGVTQFFRDPRAFEVLAKEVIPAIAADKGANDAVRVWVPGCATGEEAYSIAILLREQFAKSELAVKVQIFATDIDEDSLEAARQGRYPAGIARDVTPQRLQQFFIRDGEYYRVTKDVRDMCVFSPHNVIRDAPFSRLDLVSCRNLLIYLDASLQARVIPLFHFALKHGGYLLLGPSENVTQQAKLFTVIDAKHRIFKARPGPAEPLHLDFPFATALRPLGTADRSAGARHVEDGLPRRAARRMESHAPAYVVVDEREDILHFAGRTGKYLQPSTGAASLNLFSVLETSLRSAVRAALRNAAATGKTVIHENVQMAVEGGVQSVKLIVEPMPGPEEAPRFYVVGFQDQGGALPRAAQGADGRSEPAGREEAIAELEGDLRATRERLQSTIEELETSNEEMRASNEEFQSVNEELQSANEELETSKEELQAVNEELETVNSELNAKIDAAERAGNDRRNLLESIQIATIFLDTSLHIKSFTPAITDILSLRESDVGRELGDFVMRIAYDGLARDVRRVLRTLERVEREVTLADGTVTYMLRILPYRTMQDVIDGVVLTFIDITERKRAEEDRARLAELVAHSYDAVIGIGADGIITSWNAGAERMYGHAGAEAVGRRFAMLMPADDRANEERRTLDGLRRGRPAASLETERVTKDGRRITVTSTISPIRNPAGKVIGGSAIERDDTERKEAAAKQSLLLAELNHRVKNTLSTVLSIASRTLRHTNDLDAFRTAFEGRVRALAAAHERLAATHWSGADLRDIVTTELAPYGDRGDRVAVMGESVMLKPNAALVLSMVFHELATNAAKHGAFSNDDGRIEVGWEIDRRARALRMRWLERNGPNHGGDGHNRNGFGRQLIERTLTSDLQGRAEVEFPDGGCHWTLEIALAEAVTAPDAPATKDSPQ